MVYQGSMSLAKQRQFNKWGTPTTLTQKERATIARNRERAQQLLALRTNRRIFGSLSESKVSDNSTATYQINTTGSFTLLHIPQLGSDFNARIGRKTFMKSLYIRGRVTTEATTGASIAADINAGPQHFRMIIFVDLQPNGATPGVTDLLVEALPSSQLNLNNRDRFKVIKDKNWYVDPIVTNATPKTFSAFNKTGDVFKTYKKLGQEVIFNATNGGTIADITSGALYMFWIGNQAAGTQTDGNAIVSTRVRYTDN